MANIKSAKKRILVNNKKNLRNRSIKSALKTTVKKFYAAVAEGNKELAA
ncbi:MAG: 30S ribosomal protein S20, partial [Firmicutes bacterium]|nr:30S ribosomal protein S20 [Bacillota bacterium]